MAQGGSRQKRKRRQRGRQEPAPAAPASNDEEAPAGYSRSRAKDDAARAALKPLAPGERPTAVTVGAAVALFGCVSNIVGLVAGFEPSDGDRQPALLILGAIIMGGIAIGMWQARYWAVLGLQTILGFTMVLAALALTGAKTVWVGLVIGVILAAAGTLFWFLIKSLARIQMPERPGARKPGR